MDETLKKLLEMIQAIAPDVWRILLRQVVISNAFTLVVSVAIFIACSVILYRICRLPEERLKDDVGTSYAMYRIEYVVAIMLLTLIGVISFIFATGSVVPLLNPEYYAIMNLVGLLK